MRHERHATTHHKRHDFKTNIQLSFLFSFYNEGGSSRARSENRNRKGPLDAASTIENRTRGQRRDQFRVGRWCPDAHPLVEAECSCFRRLLLLNVNLEIIVLIFSPFCHIKIILYIFSVTYCLISNRIRTSISFFLLLCYRK